MVQTFEKGVTISETHGTVSSIHHHQRQSESIIQMDFHVIIVQIN
jgi:hypothetical protein